MIKAYSITVINSGTAFHLSRIL